MRWYFSEAKFAMVTAAQIQAARQQETESHNQKMLVFDALLKLVDPKTGAMSQVAWDLLGTAASGPAEVAAPVERRTLNALEKAIWRLFLTDANREWTSASVRQGLVQRLYSLPTNYDAASNAISAALAHLTAGGYIDRVYKGRGRDPHRYKLRPDITRRNEEEVAPEETTS